MKDVQKEAILYGLEHHQEVIDQIIQDIDLAAVAFDIRLILVEAITNAYYHGNLGDNTKPIYIRFLCEDKQLNLEVEDCGTGSGQLIFPEELSNDELLDEGGRGLYLIRCFSDSVEMIHSTLHIKKIIPHS
mgnify:CR=1 FL=1